MLIYVSSDRFPNVLTYLQSALHRNEDEFSAVEMTKETEMDDVIEKLKEVTSWLKSLDCYHGDKINQYSDVLENSVVQAVMQKVEDSQVCWQICDNLLGILLSFVIRMLT